MDKTRQTDILFRIAKVGDEQAFRELYYMYYDRLFRFVMHIVRCEEWCEEIISDVFFNIWQNKQHLLQIQNLEAYLFKAVKNKSLHYADKAKRHPVYDELSVTIDYVPDSDNPESLLLNDELNKVLQAAIESLPDRCRTIFKLVREDGMTYKQTADILGISIRTIDAQIAIAVKKITVSIKKYLII